MESEIVLLIFSLMCRHSQHNHINIQGQKLLSCEIIQPDDEMLLNFKQFGSERYSLSLQQVFETGSVVNMILGNTPELRQSF
ncbi:hypothetical protein PEB0150_020400 [Bartonella apis]|uniref:hypothetical protein n=1 Tax=Bartonella apis TaxID=1686310 RepID=UPI0009668F27|nr:hypothetical protein [Bartonella apis]OLY45337.1 hypothetical protein PEB0150_020400 [Bartonella apis]